MMEVCNTSNQAAASASHGDDSLSSSSESSYLPVEPKLESKRRRPRSDIGRKHETLSYERKIRSDTGPDQPCSDTGHNLNHEKLSDQRPLARRSDFGHKHEKLSDQPRSDTGSTHKRRKIQAAPKPTAAQTYGEKYQSELRFLTCACCAFEGPRSGFKSLSSLKERGCLNWHGHSKRTIVQTLMDSSFLYDRRYGMALDTGLDEYGMLPGLKVS